MWSIETSQEIIVKFSTKGETFPDRAAVSTVSTVSIDTVDFQEGEIETVNFARLGWFETVNFVRLH